jgi:hypothetical protein
MQVWTSSTWHAGMDSMEDAVAAPCNSPYCPHHLPAATKPRPTRYVSFGRYGTYRTSKPLKLWLLSPGPAPSAAAGSAPGALLLDAVPVRPTVDMAPGAPADAGAGQQHLVLVPDDDPGPAGGGGGGGHVAARVAVGQAGSSAAQEAAGGSERLASGHSSKGTGASGSCQQSAALVAAPDALSAPATARDAGATAAGAADAGSPGSAARQVATGQVATGSDGPAAALGGALNATAMGMLAGLLLVVQCTAWISGHAGLNLGGSGGSAWQCCPVHMNMCMCMCMCSHGMWVEVGLPLLLVTSRESLMTSTCAGALLKY